MARLEGEKKSILPIIIGVALLAALGFGAYALINKGDASNPPITTTTTQNSDAGASDTNTASDNTAIDNSVADNSVADNSASAMSSDASNSASETPGTTDNSATTGNSVDAMSSNAASSPSENATPLPTGTASSKTESETP